MSDGEQQHHHNRVVALKASVLLKFRRFFHGIGGYIYDHPLRFIIASSAFALVAAISFLTIQFETSAENLYALPASQARADLAKQTSLFGVPPRISMVFVVNQAKDSTNVLTKPVLRKLARLDHFLHHEMASSSGLTFEDICYRQEMKYNLTLSSVATGQVHPAAECMKMTPLDLYRDERLYGTPIVTRNWPYVPNLASNKIVKADLALTDPKVAHSGSGTTRIFGATGFLLLYHAAGDEANLARTLEWEQAMVDFINHDLKPFSALDSSQPAPPARAAESGGGGVRQLRDDKFFFPNFEDHDWSDFRVFVNAERSWQDELARSTKFDARLIRDYVVAYVIIAIYMVVFNRTDNLIRSKSVCGFLGSVSALFGYVAGGGICYWAGMKHCPTMHASPFLVLAIGLDNTFVVLNFYTLSYGQISKPKDRCRNALTDSGLALFITTFTSVLSFAVGALGPYTAVRNFCIQTGMGLCGGFIYNIIFFYPFLCLEARAESAGQIFFLSDKWAKRWLTEPAPPPAPPASRGLRLADESTRISSLTPEPVDSFPLQHRRNTTLPVFGASSAARDSSLVFSPQTVTPETIPLAVTEYSIDVGPERQEPAVEPSFVQKMDMFQIASLQWQFASRLKALTSEVEKRRLDLTGDVLDDARSALPSNIPRTPHQWATMEPAEMLNCDLKTSHRAADMGLKLLEEPHGNKGKRTRRTLMRWFGPALTNGVVQRFMLLCMAAYLIFFICVALTKLTAGLELENLSPPDSYLREAFAVSHDKFPIFPKQTFVMFTAPAADASAEELAQFGSNDYGVRDPEIVGSRLVGWLRSENSIPLEDYVQTLGEVPWWQESTLLAMMQLDARLRGMPEVQDVLNGMLLFYDEQGKRVFAEGNSVQERRVTFYRLLNQWLRHGVVGQQVRDQFKFDSVGLLPLIDIGDGQSIPQLIGFRCMVFNYNFLNSYSQSHYMLKVRQLMRDFTQTVWPNGQLPNVQSEHEDWEASESALIIPPIVKPPRGEGEKSLDAPYPKYNAILSRSLNLTGVADPPKLAGGLNFVPQAFMDTFLFFETDATIWRTTLLNMLTAFISILVASSILMEGWTSVVLVTIMICSVDIGVFGGMALLGLQLNILTMILLVLSIGFSVDYTVHVIHTFCHTVGKHTRARAVETMILICSPMTHGALSTLLGILPIYFRKEYVLQNFFWMMALVILFGFLNGVIFLPIIMSRSRHWLMRRADRELARNGELGEQAKEMDKLTYSLIAAIQQKDAGETAPKLRREGSPHTTAETLMTL